MEPDDEGLWSVHQISVFNTKGFLVGTKDYKNCVLNKGNKN